MEVLPVFSRLVEESARGRLLLTVLNVGVCLYVLPRFNEGSAALLFVFVLAGCGSGSEVAGTVAFTGDGPLPEGLSIRDLVGPVTR